MIKLRMTIDSIVLYRPVEVVVAIPHGFLTPKGPFKTVWALHCAMGDGELFFHSLGLTGVIDKENIIVIAPSMGNGYYINSAFERQADFLNDELFPAIRDNLPVSTEPADNMLLGISMGGFGAIRWALESSGQFGAVAAISSVFDIKIPPDERAKKNREQRPMLKLFGEQLMPKLLLDEFGAVLPEADMDKLLSGATAKSSAKPRLALYCGEQDYLSLKQTSIFAENCKQRGLEVYLHLSPGGHNLAYWSGIVPNAIDWFLHGRAD